LQGKLQLELIHGELSDTFIRMRHGLDLGRPSHFPNSFTRIWTSNIP
jgi:hypothetical protein